jgi:excisionase family DNA binding protein
VKGGDATVTEEGFLSPQQIAAQLQITDRAVLDLIKAGKLRGMRVGTGRGVWRVARSAFEAFLQERLGNKEPEQT